MPPKKVPKVETVVQEEKKRFDEFAWRAALQSISINDQHWWCIVTMMVETITDHAQYVSIFNDVAEDGNRRTIYALSREKALANVRVLSRQPPEKCPVAQHVCHYASKFLRENGGSLPTWLTAWLIKYFIQRAKIEMLGRIRLEAELEQQIDEEYRIMRTVNTGGLSRGKGSGHGAMYSKGKANTRLRRRDEEWRDVVNVDDAPIDGANLYIVLTGFYDPDLPAELVSVGVPLTCVLRIKRPSEKLEGPVGVETNQEVFSQGKKLPFLEGQTVGKLDLYRFWTLIEKDLVDPTRMMLYSDVVFLTFCPPVLPESPDDFGDENLRRDVYDRVSYIVYDLYDLLRHYSDYLKSMKIVSVADKSERRVDSEVYRTVLDALPAECVFVPTILHALVLQVEANVEGRDSKFVIKEKSVDSKLDTFAEMELTDENEKESPIQEPDFAIHEKLKQHDIGYELVEEDVPDTDNVEIETPTIQLLPHGDTLQRDTYHVEIDQGVRNFAFSHETAWVHAILRVLYDIRICGLWNYHTALSDFCKKKYECHLKNIMLYYDPKDQIDLDSMAHYLHMLVFDKMIHDRPTTKKRIVDRCERDGNVGKTCSLTESETSLTLANNRLNSDTMVSAKPTVIHQPQSDSSIDYNKPIPGLINAARLFCLTDMRETLAPGYLQKNVFSKRHTGRWPLEEYDDAEFVPREVFLQTLYESIQAFDRFETSYVEPTDTVLLYFANNHAFNDVHLASQQSNIRTAVSLREFAKYIIGEEKEWIARKVEQCKLEMLEATRKLVKSAVEKDELAAIFGDEHFILPGSLKAHDLMKRNELDKQREQLGARNSAGQDGSKERKGTKDGDVGESKEAKRTRRAEVKEKAKETEERGRDKRDKKAGRKAKPDERMVQVEADGDTSFLPPRKILTYECAQDGEPYEFVGYDLGRFRVQVLNSTKNFFSADDTLVRIEFEEWLYRRTDLRIAVTLRGCELRLLRNIVGARRTPEMCHFTTSRGIVFAFARSSNFMTDAAAYRWQDLDFDFRASWPSGLLIEPTVGDGPENPFYIRQSYISKGPECADIIHEVCRKFLRNGTVLKYMADGRVVVLRPNDGTLRSQEPKHSASQKTSKFPTKVGRTQNKTETLKRSSLSTAQQLTDRPSDLSASEEFATAEVSRYTVLCYDGRHYEVFNDLVVREHDRLLVRTASDYEVDEKFTRRADGTDMLLNSNGELVIHFTDGTRITTGYAIEDDPIISEWSEEEFYRYFVLNEMYGYGNVGSDDASSTNSGLRERLFSGGEEDTHEVDMTAILIADGFVSVLLTCRMEHKNYATVAYDQTTVNCTLSTPGDLRVSISRRGHYEVSMAAEVNLKIHPDTLIFSNDVCACCGGKSVSTYVFADKQQDDEGRVEIGESPRTIFTTVDVFGNVFEVKDDGTTRYRAASRSYERADCESKWNGNEQEEAGEDRIDLERKCDEEEFGNEESAKFVGMRRRDHGRYCHRFGTPLRSRYRIFAMNRDLTAYEYLHRSARREHEVDAVFGDGASAILYPISRRPQLHRLITFLPLQPESRSKALLQLYRDPVLRPTNHDRRDLIRSTYSIPYHWLFPFGRNGDGIWKNTHDVPLNKKLVRHVPDLLRVRVLHNFKEPDRNAIIDLQAALGRYWMTIVRKGDLCPASVLGNEEDSLNEDSEDNLKRNLLNITLGIQKHIDVATYESGLLENKTCSKPQEMGKSKKLIQFLERRESMKSVYEWYRECLRQKYILPYFENIIGSCFLWVKNCVDEAVKIAEKATSASTIEMDQSKEGIEEDLQ